MAFRNNPYEYRKCTPNLFYGRDPQLQTLVTGLRRGKSFALTGARRMGKTTLLSLVARRLQTFPNDLVVYVDGVRMPFPLEEPDLWQLLMDSMAEAITRSNYAMQLDTRAASSIGTLNTKCRSSTDFRTICTEWVAHGLLLGRVILLFDEIEKITLSAWHRMFFDSWRALLAPPQIDMHPLYDRFAAVFAGAHELNVLAADITSPLRNVLESESLRCLSFEATAQLMDEPSGMVWSDDLKQQVFEITGGHPMLVQYLMSTLCEAEDPSSALQQGASVFLEKEHRQFQDLFIKYCPSSARRLYSCIPHGHTVERRVLVEKLGVDSVNINLAILLHTGIIREVTVRRVYTRNITLFCQWYDEIGQHLRDGDETYNPDLYNRIAAVHPGAAQKYLAAWENYGPNRPNCSGVFVELRGIIEQLAEKFASKSEVGKNASFKLEEPGKPNLREQITYLLQQLYPAQKDNQPLEIQFNLLKMDAEYITKLQRAISTPTHGYAQPQQALEALRKWESFIPKLLPPL